MATSTSDLTASSVPTRRRYVRSNTSSVTQILSDSCNSILQRFRRNPSEKPDKRSQFRSFNDLAPSASSSALFGGRADRQSSTASTSDYGSLGSSSDSVHRTPYSSFNSTMSSYYKPLLRTFGKRYDSSPKRETEDKDKTPIVVASSAAEASNGKPSAVSRLESKYSDILDRVHRRKEIKDDKEKTLEPERTPTNFGSRGFNALAKSATTSHVRDEPFSSALKERTPYRLATQRNRNKFLESLEMDYYKKRAELAAKTSGSSSTVDSLFERNHRELSSSSKYVLKPRSKDSGYYDSKSTLSLAAASSSAAGKENIFKSKYDPDEMLSEFNGSSILAGSSAAAAAPRVRRTTRPYKRSDTTALSFLQHSSTSANIGAATELDSDRKREHRRSGNFHQLQRSATQGFFDADGICTSPSTDDPDADTPTNDPKQIERNHRRKEIESILAKYAPLEDKKPAKEQSIANPHASDRSPESALSRIKSPTTGSRFHHRESRLAHYGPSTTTTGGLQKSFTMSNVSSHLNGGSGGGLYNGNGSILTIHTGASSAMYKQQQALQHQLLMRSSRSRIPKALSTFVRML